MKPVQRCAAVAGVVFGGLFTATPAGAACAFGSTVAVSFPAYDVFSGADDDGTGTLSLSCTTGTSVRIALSAGGAGSFQPRSMAGPGASVLDYNLYSDGGRTAIWGDGTGGSAPIVASLGAGVASTFTVYARIFRNQRGPIAGLYGDSIMITVSP